MVRSLALALWNETPRDFLSLCRFLPQVSFCWRSPASWKLPRWHRRPLSLTARSLMWFSVRRICSGKTPSWDLFSAFHELMSHKNQSVSFLLFFFFFFTPPFSPQDGLANSHPLINFHSSYSSYQSGKVRADTCLLQEMWSQTVYVFEVLFMLHHTLYTQAHRSPLLAIVSLWLTAERVMTSLQPRQHSQFCSLDSWPRIAVAQSGFKLASVITY